MIYFNQQITVLEQEKLTRELNEKDAELKEQHIKVTKLEEKKERLSKEMEEEKKERKKRDKNIADATQRIDELERQNQEQLQVIKNLTKENERLKVSHLHVIV